MRRLFLSAIILATTSLAANAQKGTILLAGDVNYQHVKTPSAGDDIKSNIFSINPTIGYQFDDNWTAGIVGGYGVEKTEDGADIEKVDLWNVGPFIRYTKPVSEIFSLYGQLDGRFGQGKTTLDNGVFETESKFDQTQVNLFPAVFINLNKGFGLNFNMGGITYQSLKPEGGEAITSLGISFGKSFGFGVSKNF